MIGGNVFLNSFVISCVHFPIVYQAIDGTESNCFRFIVSIFLVKYLMLGNMIENHVFNIFQSVLGTVDLFLNYTTSLSVSGISPLKSSSMFPPMNLIVLYGV